MREGFSEEHQKAVYVELGQGSGGWKGTFGMYDIGTGDDPFDSGVRNAETRLARYNLSLPHDKVIETLTHARDLLDREEELPGRAVELFAELVAVGASMRAFYEEPDLDDEDLHGFFITLKIFENSWFHPPP